jgi:hypothetical protein
MDEKTTDEKIAEIIVRLDALDQKHETVIQELSLLHKKIEMFAQSPLLSSTGVQG